MAEALSRGHGSFETFTNDGEGYTVHVIRVDDPATLGGLAVPYHGKYAGETNRKAVRPHQLLPAARREGAEPRQ